MRCKLVYSNFLQSRTLEKSEIYFKIFSFTFYISYTCIERGKDVMSYFASSSSSTRNEIQLITTFKYF